MLEALFLSSPPLLHHRRCSCLTCGRGSGRAGLTGCIRPARRFGSTGVCALSLTLKARLGRSPWWAGPSGARATPRYAMTDDYATPRPCSSGRVYHGNGRDGVTVFQLQFPFEPTSTDLAGAWQRLPRVQALASLRARAWWLTSNPIVAFVAPLSRRKERCGRHVVPPAILRVLCPAAQWRAGRAVCSRSAGAVVSCCRCAPSDRGRGALIAAAFRNLRAPPDAEIAWELGVRRIVKTRRQGRGLRHRARAPGAQGMAEFRSPPF